MNGIIGAFCPSDEQRMWIKEYCNDAENIVYEGSNWIVKCFYPPDYKEKGQIVHSVHLNKTMVVFGNILPNGKPGTLEQWSNNSILHTFDGEFVRIVIDSLKSEAEVLIDQNYCTPLFYAQSQGGGIFTSYLNVAHTLIGSPRTMCEKGVYDVLAYGYSVGEDTIFSNIKKLRSGHGVQFSKRSMECFQYSRKSNSIDNIKVDENDVMSAMVSATKLRLKKENVAIAMSGGMDSRFMLGLMTKYFKEYALQAYMWSQPHSEELYVAQSACYNAGVELNPIILNPSDFIKDFYKCCKFHGGNDYVFQSFGLQVGEEISKQAQTCVTGYSMGSIFGSSFAAPQLINNTNVQPDDFFKSQSGLKSKAFSNEELTKYSRIVAKDYELRLYEEYCRFLHEVPYLQTQYFRLHNRASNLILYRDFLPHQYVEFIYPSTCLSVLQILDRIPFEEKALYQFYRKMFVNQFEKLSKVEYFNTRLPIAANTSYWQKSIDIETQRERLFSEAFYNSKPSFPYKKYYSDYNHWIVSDPAWKKMMEDTISDDSPLCNLVLDRNYLQQMYDEHISGKANHRKKLLTAATLDHVMRFYKVDAIR